MNDLTILLILFGLTVLLLKKRKKPKRKSGNGTSARQWLYILINFPFVWVVKVGIAGDFLKRWRDVDKSAPGWDFPIFAVKIRFAYQIEQWIHRRCKVIRIPFWGSGKTERFFFSAAFLAVLTAILVFIIEWSLYLSPLVAVWYWWPENVLP